MRSVIALVSCIWWAVFFAFLTYLVSWVLLAKFFGVPLLAGTTEWTSWAGESVGRHAGDAWNWPQWVAAVIGLGFGVHAYSTGWQHHGPGILDFLLFPLRYAAGIVLAVIIDGVMPFLLWRLIHPSGTAAWVIGGAYVVFVAFPAFEACFSIPFLKDLTLSNILRSVDTARRIGFPSPSFFRNYIDEKIQDAREGTLHLRGARLMSRRHAAEMASALQGRAAPPPLRWCGIPLPRELSTTGFLATGMTGSGKTAHLGYLLRSFLPELGQHGDSRAVIYDYKTEVMPLLFCRLGISPERVRLFHPFDRRTAVWDIAADIRTESDALELTRTLLPAPSNHPDAEFFGRAAGLVVSGVVQTLNTTAPRNWDLRDLVLALEDPQQIKEILSACPANRSRLRSFFSTDAPAMTASVVATIAKDVQYYRVVAAQWYEASTKLGARKYNLGDWMAGNDIVVLGHSPAHYAAVRPIMRLVFELMAKRVLDESQHVESRPDRTWFVLDELPNLGKLDMLGELLRAGRSKGVCSFLGFQDLSSLYKEYDQDTAHSLLNNIGNQAYLKLNDPKTAEWASKFFTDREVLRRTRTLEKGGDPKTSHEATLDRAIVPPRLFLEANHPGKRKGFFDSDQIGSWQWELPVAEIIRDVASPNEEEKRLHAYVRMEEVPLAPWTKEDLKRLGLKLSGAKPRRERKKPTPAPDSRGPAPWPAPPSVAAPYRKHRSELGRSNSEET